MSSGFRVVSLLALVLPLVVDAQAPTPTPCTAPAYRQLDFWIGEWRVIGPQGKHVGDNTISPQQGGCFVREQWRSSGGSNGESMNFFNPSTRSWHQVWVDNSGGVLMFTGTPETNAMVYRGQTGNGDRAQRHVLSLRLQPDGTVRQLWETWPLADSSAAARVVSFDGIYHRVK
ncbi:MAG: hypothetical protein IPK85_07835 [Gemmatimonadetes bacterium]|nr:hypothetical protein [Gemmatimonadota bacterium]